MTNSELFTAAHKLARTFEGNYTARFVLALEIIRSEEKQDLASYIISNMNDSSDWNEKFYQKNNGTVEIYISNVKHDVTEMFNEELNNKGYFIRSEFDAKFNPMLEKMIDAELELV